MLFIAELTALKGILKLDISVAAAEKTNLSSLAFELGTVTL